MVAAWIKAETGVGQLPWRPAARCRGGSLCGLAGRAEHKDKAQWRSRTPPCISGMLKRSDRTDWKLNVPKWAITRNMARRKPKSPIPVDDEGFFPAVRWLRSSWRNRNRCQASTRGQGRRLPRRAKTSRKFSAGHGREREEHEEIQIGEKPPEVLPSKAVYPIE